MTRLIKISKSEPKRLSKRRLIENEALVRKMNEQVQKAVEAAFPAKERTAMSLHFYCECADVKCEERITLSPDEYKKIHRNRRHFIAKPGHLITNIERMTEKHRDYIVLEKISFGRVRRLLQVRLKTKKHAKV